MSRDHSRDALIPAELVARLEVAEAGSQELDTAIFRAFGDPLPKEFAGHNIKLTWQDDGSATVAIGEMQVRYDPPRFTTSLDAALALAERVLPGWWIEVKQRHTPDEAPQMKWSAEVEWPEPITIQSYGETLTSHEFYHSFAPTPALALCIAILKATPTGSKP